MSWKIIARPEGRNGEPESVGEENAVNRGGLVFYLTESAEGFNKQEIGRVAFDRGSSRNPRVSFLAQCKKTADKAVVAVKYLNTDLLGDGELD